MSEVKVVLRDTSRSCSGNIPGFSAAQFVAALAADPVTLEELDVAVERFMPRHEGRSYFSGFRNGIDDEPWDAGLVVIDLAAKLVYVNSTYSHPGQEGSVDYHNGQCATDIRCRYRLKDDWCFTSRWDDWRSRAEKRRAEFAATEPLDVRAILYGRPMIEFLATECFRQFVRRDELLREAHAKWIADRREWIEKYAREPQPYPESVTLAEFSQSAAYGNEKYSTAFWETLKDIHARWLMTARKDLRGQTPREMLWLDHDRLNSDLDFRRQQWDYVGHCPRGLDETSHAFRFGGFGTHEMVEYYELVRHLLWSCWERLHQQAAERCDSIATNFMTVGDFLMTEVPRLEQVREEWLDELAEDISMPLTPREIITHERRRLPEGVPNSEAMHDPDCPCCQMLADMPGFSFWHLDGCNMDNDFAFSIQHETLAKWETEQREWAEMNREIEASRKARIELGVDYGDEAKDPIWSSSYTTLDGSENDATVTIGIRVFGIGCNLAELIGDLRLAEAPQATIDELNRHFGNLRQVLGQTTEVGNASLIEPVVERFIESINALTSTGPHFDRKTADLIHNLSHLTTPPPPSPPRDWSSEDLEFPF